MIPLGLAALAALAFLFFTEFGRVGRDVQPVQTALDRALATVGLQLQKTEISGLVHADARRVFEALDATGAKTLVGFDADALQRTIVAQSPWIASAEVVRGWPNRLSIVLRERRPFAVFGTSSAQPGGAADGGTMQAWLIDRDGVRLQRIPASRLPPLPRVFGGGAEAHAAVIVDAVAAFPDLARDVVAYERVGNRRWTLRLRDGRQLLLPARGIREALERFALSMDLPSVLAARTVDLRTPGRIILRPRLSNRAHAARRTSEAL